MVVGEVFRGQSHHNAMTLGAKFAFVLCVVLIPALAASASEHYQRLHSFSGPDGSKPYAKLTLASDGAFYGTTSAGGTNNHGTIFKLTLDGQYTAVLNFGPLPTDAANPRAEVIEAGDGALYGTTITGGGATNGAVFKVNKDGSNFRVLYSFPGGSVCDLIPYAGLIYDKAGAVYGTTSTWCFRPASVYALNLAGTDFRTLYDQIPSNGEFFSPEAALVLGSDGALYGTGNGGSADSYHGMIFRLDRDTGAFTLLYAFPGQGTNYFGQKSALMEASDGLVYGSVQDAGFLFRIAKDGSNYEVLHRFGNQHDRSPVGQLVEGVDESLYGVTGATGDYGTIFRINKDGTEHMILHRFGVAPRDGSSAGSGLARGPDGAFYSTTVAGGDSGLGTIYKVWPAQTPDVTADSMTNGAIQVTVTGMSGYNYQLLASEDLITWAPLASFVMPVTGTYTYSDTNAATSARFYRPAWRP